MKKRHTGARSRRAANAGRWIFVAAGAGKTCNVAAADRIGDPHKSGWESSASRATMQQVVPKSMRRSHRETVAHQFYRIAN